MTIDALAFEQQFLDHLAPVWAALPPSARGRFLVAPSLVDRARAKGIEPELLDPDPLRKTPQRPANTDGMPALVASIGDIKVGRRIGYGPFAFLEHGAGQSYGQDGNASYAGGLDRADNELFMCPNEYSANLWRRAYPTARVVIVGCPKLDSLPQRSSGGPPTVAVSWHWPAPIAISGYAGTAFGEYAPALGPVAERFAVIGHQHPNWLARRYPGPPSKTYARLGIPFIEDFEDVCRRADVFVADNTSCLFEFAATGRPVIVVNARYWSRKDPHPPGLRFWDAAHVGINVDRPEDLIPAVEEALADAPVRQIAREDALRLVYGLRTNGAAAAATAIGDWLATKQEVAA